MDLHVLHANFYATEDVVREDWLVGKEIFHPVYPVTGRRISIRDAAAILIIYEAIVVETATGHFIVESNAVEWAIHNGGARGHDNG